MSKSLNDLFRSNRRRAMGSISGLVGALLLTAAALPAQAQAQAASPTHLRVCSDPDNLPFSKSEGPDKGLYIDLAEKVGQRLGMPVDYVWWLTFNQRRAMRNSMAGCDAYFALPADADYKVRGLLKTSSFLNVSYAAVSAPGQSITTLNDLKNKRVGVLFGSPPQILLAVNEGFNAQTFRTHEQAFEALNKHEIDVALLWGPSAGYDNVKQFNNQWQVTPISGEGMGGQVAVAVQKDQPELKEKIDQALKDLQPEIAALAKKYGFPSQLPVNLSSANRASEMGKNGAADHVVAVTNNNGNNSKFMRQVADMPAKISDEALQAAKSRFNNTCSHCHGANGASPISERDLRKLKSRYKDQWQEVAYTTITKGRPELGMPTWGVVIPDDEIKNVIQFLATVQR